MQSRQRLKKICINCFWEILYCARFIFSFISTCLQRQPAYKGNQLTKATSWQRSLQYFPACCRY